MLNEENAKPETEEKPAEGAETDTEKDTDLKPANDEKAG